MESELKALHQAVEILLKARRDVKRTAHALRKSGSGLGGSGWDRIPYIDQLQHSADSASSSLRSAEINVLASWEALNVLPQ